MRSSSPAPSSNSWLPTLARSSPARPSASTVDSSWNAAESSGDAPIRSPVATVIVFGRATSSASVQREQLHLHRRRSVFSQGDDHGGRNDNNHDEAAHDQQRPAGKQTGHAVNPPGPRPNLRNGSMAVDVETVPPDKQAFSQRPATRPAARVSPTAA